MGFLGHSPTRRAIGMACALAWYIPVADLAAGTLEQADSPGAPQLSQPSAEPFGLSVSRVFAGPLREKWRSVERKLDDERVQLALCDGDRERCASPAALRFLAIVDSARERDGRARLGEVNRAVNLAIRPMSDQAHMTEYWVRNGDLLTQIFMLFDPVYLTEPLVKSTEFVRSPRELPAQTWLWVCDPVVDHLLGGAAGDREARPGQRAHRAAEPGRVVLDPAAVRVAGLEQTPEPGVGAALGAGRPAS